MIYFWKEKGKQYNVLLLLSSFRHLEVRATIFFLFFMQKTLDTATPRASRPSLPKGLNFWIFCGVFLKDYLAIFGVIVDTLIKDWINSTSVLVKFGEVNNWMIMVDKIINLIILCLGWFWINCIQEFLANLEVRDYTTKPSN